LKTVVTTRNLAGITFDNKPVRVIIGFGTGQQIPQTVTSPTKYASGAQYLYGIWDWDMNASGTGWNAISPQQQAIGLAAPQAVTTGNLQLQTIATVAAVGSSPAYRTLSKTPVCWKGAAGCGTSTTLGWYVQLPGTGEQVIFDPILSPDGEFVVNTFIPASSTPLDCKAAQSSGFSMGVDPLSGGGSLVGYFYVNSNVPAADGVQLNGVGIPALLSSGQTADGNAEYFITQTTGGSATPNKINRAVIVSGTRLNWLQRR
jgi:type IV pilus assembly protein PilY1